MTQSAAASYASFTEKQGSEEKQKVQKTSKSKTIK